MDAAYARALDAREQLLERDDGAAGRRLLEIAERRGELVAQAGRPREAHGAGREAQQLLAEAPRLLGGARSRGRPGTRSAAAGCSPT